MQDARPARRPLIKVLPVRPPREDDQAYEESLHRYYSAPPDWGDRWR
jgi:hypothetical protein